MQALDDAIWVDPRENRSKTTAQNSGLREPPSYQASLIPHPTSNDMKWILEHEIARDPEDLERLHRISRLQLDTQYSKCRIKPWEPLGFKECLGKRRLIFVGDSMTMQQAESLSYLLDLTSTWTHTDRSERKKGVSRHSIDAKTPDTGLEILARAVFYSDEEDGTPLRFNKEAWEMMVQDFGGWQGNDILIVNFGAHYMANVLDLRQDLEVLFYQVLLKIPSFNVTIFWRDYAPAHFQAFPDGEYPPSHFVKRANEPACVPHLMAPKTPSIVKHVVVDKIMEECGDPCRHQIRRLNVWGLLRNAWDQHKEGSHCFADEWCDCRHYAIPGPMDYANVLLYNQLCVSSGKGI